MAVSIVSNTIKFNCEISKLSELDEQFTPQVMVHGIPWEVKFKNIRGEGEEWLAVYLSCENKDASRDWSYTAFATIKVLPFEKNVEPIKGYIPPYIFGKSHRILGMNNFTEWEWLTNVENGFVRNDTIRMKIKIEVTDPNDKDKSILKVDVLDKCCGLGSYISFRMTVSNIDELVAVGTPEFKLRGLRWKMSIYNNTSKWLGVLLEIIGDDITDEFTCKTTAVVKLISTKDDAKTIKRVLEDNLNQHDIMDECKFVSWDDLFDDQKGFVRDNATVFEVKIVAEQPDNAVHCAKKRQTANDQNEEAKFSKLECSICMEAIRDQDVSSLPCTHMFCTKCIEDAIKARKKCPICNAAAKLTDLRLSRLPFTN
ncbi:uncharacterized protein LOC116346271 [Contarinia nasturtii]|uniref:uncharacterized protein LOC116346271 n=1 Tax=Contarinia nasturtii TaxID=265458 RepID=UPI0012D43304|nr:uncharacterized protein LOC116346271 [Contarinia nasturtii]